MFEAPCVLISTHAAVIPDVVYYAYWFDDCHPVWLTGWLFYPGAGGDISDVAEVLCNKSLLWIMVSLGHQIRDSDSQTWACIKLIVGLKVWNGGREGHRVHLSALWTLCVVINYCPGVGVIYQSSGPRPVPWVVKLAHGVVYQACQASQGREDESQKPKPHTNCPMVRWRMAAGCWCLGSFSSTPLLMMRKGKASPVILFLVLPGWVFSLVDRLILGSVWRG